MIINLPDRFKSLFPFSNPVVLPQLTIITGKNGSGKTHFLEAFVESGAMLIYDNKSIPEGKWRPSNDFSFFDRADLSNLDTPNKLLPSTTPGPGYPRNQVDDSTYKLIDFILEHDLMDSALDKGRTEMLSTEEAYIGIIDELTEGTWPFDSETNDKLKEQRCIEERLTSDNVEAVKEVRRRQAIMQTEFRDSQVGQYYPDLVAGLRLSQITLGNLHDQYISRRYDNRVKHALAGTDSLPGEAISDEQFVKNYPPPLETLNGILSRNELGFRLTGPTLTEYHNDKTPKIGLINQRLNTPFQFNELSSGESKIFGIILKIFYSIYFRGIITYPKLLLFDEPDAHLHPEFVQMMLGILQDEFITKKDVSIIMTTHSPTTVAIAPDDSIFEIRNGEPTIFRSIHKDDALNILTDFLPTLSIDYKNHRQIFTESDRDLQYYQAIFDAHYPKNKNSLPHRLYFVSGSKGNSNCETVKTIVKALRDGGSVSAFGILDYDNGAFQNGQFENIYVHGQGERYSLENLIFDPIYCIAYLLSKDDGLLRTSMGLSSNYSHLEMAKESETDLQQMIDQFYAKMCLALPAFPFNAEREFTYCNGVRLRQPANFMMEKGHTSFLPKINKAFPDIPANPNGPFYMEMIEMIAQLYPLVPSSSIQLLERLARP